jgi:hypothetical protein
LNHISFAPHKVSSVLSSPAKLTVTYGIFVVTAFLPSFRYGVFLFRYSSVLLAHFVLLESILSFSCEFQQKLHKGIENIKETSKISSICCF